MKTLMHKAAALLLALALVLGMTACGEAPAKTDAASQPAGTESVTKTPESQTKAPETEAPTTAEPTTEEPTTEAPLDLSGYYVLVSMPADGGEEKVKEYNSLGYTAFIVLEPEGKGYLHLWGSEDEVTWDEKAVTYKNSPISFDLKEDGTLTLYQNKQEYMIFHRSEEKAPERGETNKAMIGLYRTDEISLKDVTLIDNEEYSLVANEILAPRTPNDGYVIRFTITNKTIDDSLVFSVDHMVINGISVQADRSGSSSSVKLGQSKEWNLSLSTGSLKRAGTGDPTEIKLYLQVKPNYDPKVKFLDYVTIYPLGEDKAETIQRTPGENDQLIVDNESAALTYVGMRESVSQYAYISFWAENKTDQTTWAALYIRSVNGAEASFAGEAYLGPHTSGLLEVLTSLDRLNGLSLDEISELGFTFMLSTAEVNPKTISQGEYSVKP